MQTSPYSVCTAWYSGAPELRSGNGNRAEISRFVEENVKPGHGDPQLKMVISRFYGDEYS